MQLNTKKTFKANFACFSLLLAVSPSPNIMHFVRLFSICACLRRNDHCYQRGSKLWKNCIHQKCC